MEEKEIESVILRNLAQIKEDATTSNEATVEDNPDELIKEMPSINLQQRDEEFDYLSKKAFFDEIYFKDSRLIKMYAQFTCITLLKKSYQQDLYFCL